MGKKYVPTMVIYLMMNNIMKSITNFLSSKLNLTILQCVLYFILGYMFSDKYEWSQIAIIFVVLLGIQFITHIKGVSQGMMMFQIMQDEQHFFARYIENLKKLDRDDSIDEDLPN